VLSDGIEGYGVSGNTLIFFLFAYYDRKKKGKKLNRRPMGEKGNLSNGQSLVNSGVIGGIYFRCWEISAFSWDCRGIICLSGNYYRLPARGGGGVIQDFGNGRLSGRPRRGRLVRVNLTVCGWGVTASLTAHAVSPQGWRL
jgi:hypothetical protein